MTASSAGSACVFLCHGPDRGLALCRTRDHALSFVDSDNRTLINKCVKEAPRRFVFLVFLHGHWAHGRLLLRCEEVTRRSGKVFRHANLWMDLVDFLGDVLLRVIVEVLSVLSVLRLWGSSLLVFLSDMVWKEHILVDNFRWIFVISSVLWVRFRPARTCPGWSKDGFIALRVDRLLISLHHSHMVPLGGPLRAHFQVLNGLEFGYYCALLLKFKLFRNTVLTMTLHHWSWSFTCGRIFLRLQHALFLV